jgi:hypothetical protein
MYPNKLVCLEAELLEGFKPSLTFRLRLSSIAIVELDFIASLDPAETENVGFKKGKGLGDVKALLRVKKLGMNDVLMAITIDGLRLDGGKVNSSVGTDEAMKLNEVAERSKVSSPDKSRAEVAFRADGKLALEFDYAEGVIG